MKYIYAYKRKNAFYICSSKYPEYFVTIFKAGTVLCSNIKVTKYT